MIKIVNNLVDFKGYASLPPQNPRKSKVWIFAGLFSYVAYLTNKESSYYIQAVEDSCILVAKVSDFEKIIKDNYNLLSFYKKLVDEAQMKKVRDEFGFEEVSADSSYKKENPVEHAIMVKASESDDTELVG